MKTPKKKSIASTERRPASPSRARCAVLLLLVAEICAAGCQMWPFRSRDRLAIVTPAMRVATVREAAARGRKADPPQQEEICQQFAEQIRTEPDPIVRRSIQQAVAEFETPLAQAILMAGLNDDDHDVRLTCCQLLGERGDPLAVDGLKKVIIGNDDNDVRLAAVDALGQIDSPESELALAIAVRDRDPAMQYAGVQAMRRVCDEDLGADAAAWRQYADTLGPQADNSMAKQPQSSSPY